MSKPLAGIRVVDFCWVGAGSYATKLLADQGADVIKIESNARVDGIRLSGPFAGGQAGINRSGYFADRNTSKRSCAINMKTERGQEIARGLVRECDVVANSFTPGVMERFGLSWPEVHELNPRAVYLSMSMQGDGGPERAYMGYGLTISALVGLHALTAIPGRLPVGTGTNYPDHIPNPCHAAFAVLAALRDVRRTGLGQHIDLAQTEATIAVLGSAMVKAKISGSDPVPLGNRHEVFAPHGVYPCAGEDRWVAIAATSDDEFAALASVIGLPRGAVEGLETVGARRDSADELDQLIALATRSWKPDELVASLQSAGVPAAPVHDSQGVVVDDEQLAHRNHWVRLDHSVMGETLYNAPPFRFSGTDDSINSPAPLLGEHTAEVCGEVLGMDEAEIAQLVGDGILA